MAYYFHPLGKAKIIEGDELEGREGEILQKSDVYSAPNGEWELIPEALIGTPVTSKEPRNGFPGRTSIIVRPYK